MQKNTKSLLIVLIILVLMIGLSFAAVPLYRIFCQITGFDGTTQRAKPGEIIPAVSDREFDVRFTASLEAGIPLEFKALDPKVHLKAGEVRVVRYQARNLSSSSLIARATFNLVPVQAAQYFRKIDCFCYQEQEFKAGETKDLTLRFYIDPKIDEDPELKGIKEITKAYTFFTE